MLHPAIFPGWSELHPLIIHFPIAILLIAPLFVIMGGSFPPPYGKPFLVSALVLMLIGSGAILLAVVTGEAAAKLTPRPPAVQSVLVQHQNLAESTLILFSLLTLAFAALLLVPRYLHRELDARLRSEVLTAFLILYIAGTLFLVRTAHQGARLVHELGVTVRAEAGHTSLMDQPGRKMYELCNPDKASLERTAQRLRSLAQDKVGPPAETTK